MKTLTILLFILLGSLAPRAAATSLALVTIKQPVYMHTDGDAQISIVDTQAAIVSGVPEELFTAITWPHRPAAGGLSAEHAQQNINLASLYNITVSGNGENPDETVVTIDASRARVPKTYPFTIEQVVDAVTTCVKLMHPARPDDEGKFTIRTILPGADDKKTGAGKPDAKVPDKEALKSGGPDKKK